MLRRIHSILSNPQFRREVAKAGLAPSLERGAFEAEPPVPGFAGGKAFSEVTPAVGASLDGGIQVPPREEAIILLEERPALLVRKGRFETPRSGVWVEVLGAHRNLIEPRLQSVGRIELDEGEGFHHIGTGWVIAEKIIATNRHVAEIFAVKQGEGGKFLTSFRGVPFQARIDFREEYQEQAAFEVAVKDVVFMEGVDRRLPDIAFLRLASHDGLPEPIPLLETPAAPGAPTVVVGYPAFDARYGLDAIVAAAQVFGTIYDVKRLSPGYIIGWDDASWFFTHDATTLGGNSGSAVLDVGTGYVVGMHFKGDFRHENYAVKASKLLEYAAEHKVSVLGRRSLPQTTPIEVPGAAAEEAPPESYNDRQGYQEHFIGEGFAVPLPKLSGTNTSKVLTFRDPVTGETATVLAYTHYAVVMNSERRMCFYSAVNIDGELSVSIKGARPPWRFDSRIPQDRQIRAECYGREQEGKFSRGHMTRREDPNWGTLAKAANADTFHVTNACPQIQPFNAGIWMGLEDYALENARRDKMRICVFTGPIFQEDDPEFFGVKVPIRFWKVIAFIHDQTGGLCATGYTMSQQNQIPGEEFVYGGFQTCQTSLAEIESLAGLSLGDLKTLDPLGVVEEAPQRPLRSFDEIRFV